MAEIRNKSRQLNQGPAAHHGALREKGVRIVSVTIIWGTRTKVRNTALLAKAVPSFGGITTTRHHRRPLRGQRRDRDTGSQ